MSDNNEAKKRKALAKEKRDSLTTQSFTNSIDGSEVKLFGEQLQGGSKIDFAQLKFMYENIFPDKKIPEKEMYNMQKCADFLIDYTDFINMDAEQQVEFIMGLMRTFYRQTYYGDDYFWDNSCTSMRLASFLLSDTGKKVKGNKKFTVEAINNNLKFPITTMEACIKEYHKNEFWSCHEKIIKGLLQNRQCNKLAEPRYDDQNIKADGQDAVVVYKGMELKGNPNKRVKVKQEA